MPATYTQMPDRPYYRMATLTKSDATVYDPPIMLLRCQAASGVTVVDIHGNSVAFTAIAGEMIPGPIAQLMETGTAGTVFTGWRTE